jgi:hypothetical protein
MPDLDQRSADSEAPPPAGERDRTPPPQPGKLRLLFALAFGTVLAMRLADRFLPAGFPPAMLYVIAVGAPLAAILLAWVLHRGVFHGLLYEREDEDRERR